MSSPSDDDRSTPGDESASPASRPLAASSSDDSKQPARRRERRILIVEDNRDTAETMRLLLEMVGDQVRTAYRGAVAIEIAREFIPQIVLCDINLPGEMDGHAVARALRGEPAFQSPFLIAMSGYDSEEDSHRAMKSGFNAYLAKPVEFATLQAALDKASESA